MKEEIIRGNIVDVLQKITFPGEIKISNGIIHSIRRSYKVPDIFILPGLIDAHVHIESSMLVPSEFAKAAVRHGTIAAVSDPHEIANVLGLEGIIYMLKNASQTPFRFCFGVPSCVPATKFESSGAKIGIMGTKNLLDRDDIFHLSEVMNYPDVISGNRVVLRKIDKAKNRRKVIDGHAPEVRGQKLQKYIDAGITTDHECTTSEEAVEKLERGMKILIREGSAAKNLDALYPLIDKYPEKVMLCTDDIHPDDLENGHINKIIKKCIANGVNLFNILRAATINPAVHYKTKTGMLQQDDRGDLIIVDSLENFNILATYIKGEKVFDGDNTLMNQVQVKKINNFTAKEPGTDELEVQALSEYIKLIEVRDGSLLTGKSIFRLERKQGLLMPDNGNDVLKITVLNRYKETTPALGFIRGFGIKNGAIASSIAHDSHNIIAVGTNDIDLRNALRKIIQMKGGLVIAEGNRIEYLNLPVAGLMSDQDVFTVANGYRYLSKRSEELGSQLTSAFMTLSFMALLVIPELKISDKGLFDVGEFRITSLYA
jgi:adenine deaminase